MLGNDSSLLGQSTSRSGFSMIIGSPLVGGPGSVGFFVVHLKHMMNSDLPPQDTFDIRILMAKSVKHTVNFLETKEEDLYRCVCML